MGNVQSGMTFPAFQNMRNALLPPFLCFVLKIERTGASPLQLVNVGKRETRAVFPALLCNTERVRERETLENREEIGEDLYFHAGSGSHSLLFRKPLQCLLPWEPDKIK